MEQRHYPAAKALLEKFHAGKCTPEELALLDEWYDSLGNPGAQSIPPHDQRPQGQQLTAADIDATREAFLSRFRAKAVSPKAARLFPRILKPMLAAAVVVVAALALLWMYRQPNAAPPPESPAMLVQNGSGAIKKVTLPDGSEVWLNANTSLRWKEDPQRKERHLALTGEGYFDVQHDSERPFILHTRDLTIRVLGTRFSVEAYPGEKMSRVSLLNGKVSVQAKADSAGGAILQPGYAATYSPAQPGMQVAPADMELALSWKNGGFYASGLSMHDAIVRLCERYGYTVRWKNRKDIEKDITAALPPQSFEKMLGSLCYMNHKRFSISGKMVTIY